MQCIASAIATAALRKTERIRKEKQTFMIKSIYAQYMIWSIVYDADSAHMHGNTCGNLAPTLCFVWFLCVMLRNEMEGDAT